MKIYKKLFAYVQDKKYLGVLAIIFSAISAALTVYGYYLIYKFLDKLIINSNLSGAESIALKSVITLTSGAIFYFVSGMFSHCFIHENDVVLHVYFSRKLCSRYFRGALRRYAKRQISAW